VNRTKSNASALGCEIGLVQWDASKLPFKDSFIDIIVTDMVQELLSNYIDSLIASLFFHNSFKKITFLTILSLLVKEAVLNQITEYFTSNFC